MISMPPRMVIQQSMARTPPPFTTLLPPLRPLITVTFSTPTPVNNSCEVCCPSRGRNGVAAIPSPPISCNLYLERLTKPPSSLDCPQRVRHLNLDASVLSPQAGNVIPASQSGTPCSHDLSVQLPRCRWALGNRYG